MSSYRACSVGDVADGAAQRCDIAGVAVCVARIGDEWFAIGDVCTHAEVSLADGDVWADEYEIECPRHGAMFSLRSGLPQTLPATVPVATYPVRVEGDDVMVDVS